MVFPEGWSDADRHALLRALQDDMTAFIYTEDERFAASLEAKLGKDKSDISEAIRDFMHGLGFAIKSRNFLNEGFYYAEEEIHPFKILYETMLAQPENRAGGVWDPDELRNGLTKMRTYRHVFDTNPDLFFRRTQIWSKSVLEMRAKFYLWRELFLEEEQRACEVPMTDAKVERIRQLREIFENVPPATPPATPSTPTSMASPGLGSDETFAHRRGRPPKSKSAKVRSWSAEDHTLLVDLVVQLTHELQTTGESSLTVEISERMNRTTPSIMSKLQDIRKRLQSKKTPLRAANIPEVLYNPTSVAHKVFTSDWNDSGDPFALGYHAFKEHHNRYLHSTSHKFRPAPRRMATRGQAEAIGANDPSGQVTPKNKATTSSLPLRQQIHPVEKPSMAHSSDTKPLHGPVTSLAQPVYSEFVRDCVTMLKRWDDATTYRLCITLLKVLPSRNSIPMAKFYERVADELGDTKGDMTGHDMFLSGERILRLCQKRYGSRACFGAAIEGSDTTSAGSVEQDDVKPPEVEAEEEEQEQEEDVVHVKSTVATPVESTPPCPEVQLSAPRLPDPPTVYSTPASAPTQSYGKSNEAAMHILKQKAIKVTHVESTPIESSPSTHHYSPDHYDFDYDPGSPEEDDYETKAEPQQEQHHVRTAFSPHEADDEPESPATYTTDARRGNIGRHEHHERHRTDVYDRPHHYAPSHSSRAPGHVHMSSSKTLVIQKTTPGYCHCGDCIHGSRRRRRDHHSARDGVDDEVRSASVHHKRRHHEVYAYASTDGHYVHHQIAHKRIHHSRARDESEDDEDDESDEDEDEMEAVEAIWGKIMAPLQRDIQSLEAKRREQLEREQDRQRQQQKQQWKEKLRQQVRDEWKAANGIQNTASGNANP